MEATKSERIMSVHTLSLIRSHGDTPALLL